MIGVPWSDIDLLIIAEFDKPYLDRLSELLDLVLDTPELIELPPYTLDETPNMLKRMNPIIVDALWEGKVLYRGYKFETLLEEF